MIAYHFTDKTLRDGTPIPEIGKWLIHNGDLIPCKSGLHASRHPLDALKWAPGEILHKVEIIDFLEHGSPVDKVCGRRRKIIKTINAEKLLRDFARWCAISVVHLWDAPAVVLEYLKTGNEDIRAAAGDAAWAAAGAAAWYAAWAAAGAAARDAAGDAARAAARDAAWYAARDAARKKQRKKFKKMAIVSFK